MTARVADWSLRACLRPSSAAWPRTGEPPVGRCRDRCRDPYALGGEPRSPRWPRQEREVQARLSMAVPALRELVGRGRADWCAAGSDELCHARGVRLRSCMYVCMYVCMLMKVRGNTLYKEKGPNISNFKPALIVLQSIRGKARHGVIHKGMGVWVHCATIF